MSRDRWERIITARSSGLYESNYLKANSPDGERGVWIKHNLMRPLTQDGYGEFWIVLYARGKAPIVAKREVPWAALEVDSRAILIRSGDIALSTKRAKGTIADLSWDLKLSGGLPPLFHLPHPWMYRTGFPKKKSLTPAPNLVFTGQIRVGDEIWEIDRWVGLRGHNWGKEHAHTYAYGNCNLWDDGADRTFDGFTAKIRLGSRLSPWLSSVVGVGPDVARNRMRDWFGAGSVSAEHWALDFRGRSRVQLTMVTNPSAYAGLRYTHPDGSESYCYNTKFADTLWQVGSSLYTSRCGELEVLFPEPLDGIPLHPTPDWDAQKGDYRS